MFDRAYRLSSHWSCFSEECDRLRVILSRLKYPQQLINTTISRIIVALNAEDQQPISVPGDSPTVRIVLPLKDQVWQTSCANSSKIYARRLTQSFNLFSLATRSNRNLKCRRKNLLIINQQCVVYKFQFDLCDASYVGYTLRHLHHRMNEHKNQSSSIGKHYSALQTVYSPERP